MPAPDLSNLVNTRLKELLQLTQKKLPIKVGAKVRNSIQQNFRQGNFYGTEPWKQPLRTSVFNGPPYRPLTSDRNHHYCDMSKTQKMKAIHNTLACLIGWERKAIDR